MLCSNDVGTSQEKVVVELTFKIIFAKLGDVWPAAIAIDKSQQELKAILKVMDKDRFCWWREDKDRRRRQQVACKVLLCWFHVKKAWVENLLPQVPKDKRDDVYNCLSNLMNAASKDKFDASFDFANEGASEETPMLVNYLITRLQQAMANPALQFEVQQQLQAYGFIPPHQEERIPEKSLGETSKRGTSKRKKSPHSPPRRESKKEEKDTKKKKERKRSPSSPSSSPSSSSDESGGSSSRESPRRGHRRSHAAWRRSNKLKKFKEGGKSISFLTYDGTFGATDKVLAFIQQFDAAFGDEGFTESSKLRHVAMHFQKSARQWWASLRANGEAPRTWKNLRVSIMKQFLSSDAKDKVLTEWRSLKLTPYESIQKYVDKFWDLHLKATVYRKIDFEEQKQQFCAGPPEDTNEYVNSQRPKTISAVIHHTMVAAKINFQQGAKRNLKPMEIKEKHEHKGKNQPSNSSKGNSSNNKAKEKGVYKGKNRLTSEELERYRKDNRCFKCGEQGHAYRACPQRNARNEQPRASIIEAPKEDVHCKGSPLSYAWGKVREHDAFILFNPGSTHNFISHELATKLGIQDFEMGDAMKADGAFVGQDASVTPLIGKLRLHIQGYVDKEDFFISPLKHEDVILGTHVSQTPSRICHSTLESDMD
ncbi:hypothetical protein L7F22_016374 [Adiantum nelumboides]|nr:hypothetical protein [Adiantum nelumboides]